MSRRPADKERRSAKMGHGQQAIWDVIRDKRRFATGLTADTEEEPPMDPNMFDGLGTALFVIVLLIALAAFGLGALIF